MSPFTADAAVALPGPPWLRGRGAGRPPSEPSPARARPRPRRSGATAASVSSTSIGTCSRSPVSSPARRPTRSRLPSRATRAAIPSRAAFVMLIDGQVVHHELDEALAARGLGVGARRRALGRRGDDRRHRSLRRAQHRVRRGADRDRGPGRTRGRGAHRGRQLHRDQRDRDPAASGRSGGADREVTVLDHHSSADVEALTLPVAEMDVGTGGVLRYLAVNQLGHRVWQIASQVARAAAASSTLLAQRGARRRLRARPHRRPARGPGRVGQSARRVLRRGAADARLPHSSRPCRAEDHVRPPLQGCGRGTLALGVQRAHPRAQRSAGHDGLPDEPQPQAERGRVGRLGPEPRDRHERRALQPCVSGRSRRLRAALLSREPRRAPRASRGAHRQRLLQRGPRAVAGSRARRSVACARSPSSSVEGMSYDPRAPVLDP